MSELRVVKPQEYRRSVWKNGLGHTDEISIYPPGAKLVEGDFLWRLSSARIEKASPFSMFPNHDRILVVLSGAGMRLFHAFEAGEPEEVAEVPPLEPYEFPGDIASRCELIEGPVIDFSVFFRKGEVEASAEVAEVTPEQPHDWEARGRWNFAYVVRGSVRCGSHAAKTGETLQWVLPEDSGGGESQGLESVSDSTTLLLVSLHA